MTKENERFETTLLVNCLAGLLVIPQELRLIQQTDSFRSWAFDATKIIKSTGNGKYNGLEKKAIALQVVIEKMRHCVAHARFYFEDEKDENRITHVVFKDWDEFEIIISVEDLKAFLIKLTTSAKSKLENDGKTLLELGRKDEKQPKANLLENIKDIASKLSPDLQQELLKEALILAGEYDIE